MTSSFVALLFSVVSANQPDGLVTSIHWSNNQSESASRFTCPTGSVMVGRQHNGDENGSTAYLCATVSYGLTLATVSDADWGSWQDEAGSGSNPSLFQCPQHTVLVGRAHQGDENGDTSYACATVAIDGYALAFTPQSWSKQIVESKSQYVCSDGQVMIGRQHWGDENGKTSYLCATVNWGASAVTAGPPEQATVEEPNSNFACTSGAFITYRAHQGDENGYTNYTCEAPELPFNASVTMIPSPPSKPMLESMSAFTCPTNQAMIARSHQGDENGSTSYQCAAASVEGELMTFTPLSWTGWIAESGSAYSCPPNTFMISRQHMGDENGKTRYQCAIASLPYNSGTLPTVLSDIINQVGSPATTSSKQYASRSSMHVGNSYRLHFDIGGEGYGIWYGIASGFAGALNINGQANHSQDQSQPIPLLILVQPWATNPPYPIANGTADYLTMQGAPLTDKNVSEITRVLRKGGSIGLWVCPNATLPGSTKTNMDNIKVLVVQTMAGQWSVSCSIAWPESCAAPGLPTCSSTCVDEFAGQYSFPKICMTSSQL